METNKVNKMLLEAVKEDNLIGIKLAVKLGANINLCDNSGRSPVYRAVLNENKPMVRLLVKELGVDVSKENFLKWKDDGISYLYKILKHTHLRKKT